MAYAIETVHGVTMKAGHACRTLHRMCPEQAKAVATTCQAHDGDKQLPTGWYCM